MLPYLFRRSLYPVGCTACHHCMRQMIVSRMLSMLGVAWKVLHDFSSSVYCLISALALLDIWDTPICDAHHIYDSLIFVSRYKIGDRFLLPLPYVSLECEGFSTRLAARFYFSAICEGAVVCMYSMTTC